MSMRPAYPCLSYDGSILYFASTRPGGYGGWDLYVCFNGINGWTQPQNLGPVVNTPGNEICPYYIDRKLFFSSDWHKGMGGFDIFKAVSDNGHWSRVRSMGFPLNSEKDDLDFVWSENTETGYFASNRSGGIGEYDIYSCQPLYEENILVVKDKQDGTAIENAMVSSSQSTAALHTDANGWVIMHNLRTDDGRITLTADGYDSLEMTVRVGKDGPARYEVYLDKTNVEPTLASDVEVEEPGYGNDKTHNGGACNNR